MKKLIILSVLSVIVIAISCSKKMTPSKANEAAITPKATVTYTNNIKTLIQTKCTPCHIPANGGFKTAFDNYDAAKKYIDDMIRRTRLNPAEKDYMPFKFPRLSEAEVAVFKKWKEEGMAQ